MEKILVAINPLNPDKRTMVFALYLARLTKSQITGIVLENAVAHTLIQRDLHGFPIAFEYSDIAKNKIAAGARIEETISGFKKLCSDSGVLFEIHRGHGVPIEDVIAESRFADMLIVDAALTSNQGQEMLPAPLVVDILKNAQCPVIVAPEDFGELNEIVFCYNGSFDSIFAIRMFTYLFPQLKSKKLTVLQVMESDTATDGDSRFTEWLKCHYTNYRFEIFIGDPNHILFDFLFKRQNIFIVMGAYGRSALSTFIKKSTAGPLIKVITQPIFISHT